MIKFNSGLHHCNKRSFTNLEQWGESRKNSNKMIKYTILGSMTKTEFLKKKLKTTVAIAKTLPKYIYQYIYRLLIDRRIETD